MKPMFKESFSEDYKAFVKKFKSFENRMREGVYKFEFLPKDDFSLTQEIEDIEVDSGNVAEDGYNCGTGDLCTL